MDFVSGCQHSAQQGQGKFVSLSRLAESGWPSKKKQKWDLRIKVQISLVSTANLLPR